MTLSPSAVTEALARLDAMNGGAAYPEGNPVSLVAAAARSWVEGEEIGWCVVHRSDGVPRLGRDATTCWKAEFTKHLNAADCTIVSKRLCDGIDGGE